MRGNDSSGKRGVRRWTGAASLFVALLMVPGPAHAQEAPPADASAAAAATKPAGDAGYTPRLRELQDRVGRLKDDISRTRTRLTLIKERLLNNVIAESKLVLQHSNDLSGSYVIEEIIYYLDDNKVFYGDQQTLSSDDVALRTVYDGNLVPGHHVLAVEYVLKGKSGLFSYVDDFRFRVRSTYTFFAPRGRISVLKAEVYERGGMLSDFRDRPAVKFNLDQLPYTRENIEKVSGSKAK